MEVSRQEYWSGLPFPSPGDLPDPGINPLQPDSLVSEPLKTRGPGFGEEDYVGTCQLKGDSAGLMRLWGCYSRYIFTWGQPGSPG